MILNNFLKDIKSEKYLLIFLCVFLIYIYYIYKNISFCKKNIENMAILDDKQITEVINKYYSSDDFTKSITTVAQKIQSNGLQIVGNIHLTGNVKADGEISISNSNNTISFSDLNKKIDDKINHFKINGRCGGPKLSTNNCSGNIERKRCPNGYIYQNPCYALADGCTNCPILW
jgi:hypothetical protein